MSTPPRKRQAKSRHVFRAQLVEREAAGQRRRLRHSKRHGELVLDVAAQSVQFAYPRRLRLFVRKYDQPLKSVVGRQLLRLYSSNGASSFMCRLLSEEDAVRCTELFRDMGVEVIAVNKSALLGAEAERKTKAPADWAITGCKTALQSLREASAEDTRAAVLDYETSAQLQADSKTIIRAVFSTS